MPYTFIPKEKHARAYGDTLRISYKSARTVCRAIRRKKLTTSKRLLEGLVTGKRNLKGKYYSNTVKEILYLLNSCEKNASSQGLDISRLFVYASPHQGRKIRRRRRRSGFGSLLKSTNLEILLVEEGKALQKVTKKEKKIEDVKHVKKEPVKEEKPADDNKEATEEKSKIKGAKK